MKTGNYSVIDMFEERDLEQFIIPEIQRDYVWQKDDVLDLLTYIKDGFEGDKGDTPYLGFIYAYNDRDFRYKYFLIDGQQRITTLYLLLLALHHKGGKGIPDYMFNRQYLKLDYKVRQATHDLFIDLVNYCRDNPQSSTFVLEEQLWFHQEYANDRTITNIVNNYNCIRNWILNFHDNLPDLLKFIEEKIILSYYHIDESRQGEDLYIYMNSRGRQLEPNETLKAKYLAKCSDKNLWGAKWENWQDFFWKNKGTRPDADAGFNDFLRMAQIIQMSSQNLHSTIISNFASGKGEQNPTFESLPSNIEQLEKLYSAFSWLVDNEVVANFFQKYETKNYIVSTPVFNRRQVFFLRVLPVVSFLSITECRDEEVILRFVRFFYNVSRKESSVGKDIANQLPSAIKLMLEYGQSKASNYDVCDLVDYSKGRSVLIDDEEVKKLTIFRTPPSGYSRNEIENLFWQAEDHDIFDGEIAFLIDRYYDKNLASFDLPKYKQTWATFIQMFSKDQTDFSKVTVALLYYGNTWTQDSPYYYQNYNCQNWYEIVRLPTSTFLMQLLEDLNNHPVEYFDTHIKTKISEHFKTTGLTTTAVLKQERDLFKQIKILAGIDFFCNRKMYKPGNGYIAKDDRFFYGDKSFFVTLGTLFNVTRYIEGGTVGKVVSMLKDTIENETKLAQVLQQILE